MTIPKKKKTPPAGCELITGRTYPVRAQIAKLGGTFDGERTGWWVPKRNADAAWKLVGGRPRNPMEGFENFCPTDEQQALADFVTSCDGNLFVEAGAGCGKTTTSLWLVALLLAQEPQRVAFVTFGLQSKEDIEPRAPHGAKVMTFNGLGFIALLRAWGEIKVDEDLAWKTIRSYGATDADLGKRRAFWNAVVRLYDLGRGALAETAEDLVILATEHDMSLRVGTFVETNEAGEAVAVEYDEVNEAAGIVDRMMEDACNNKSPRAVIDLGDQQWLPVVLGIAMPKYDTIVIDEAQDTNACQLALIKLCVAAGARILAVGDRNQSIYVFRGADSRAVDAIIEAFDMTRMPLMTTFRCAQSIVREAQKIVPEYRAGANNPEGIVRSINIDALVSQVRAGDFIISRTNAPLVTGCVRLLARGIPAAVVGKNLGKTLVTLAKKVMSYSAEPTVEGFEAAVAEWSMGEIKKLEKKVPVPEAQIERISDNAECLLAFARDADTFEGMIDSMNRVLVDKSKEGRVDFTSTHRAKGLERERVFLLRDTFLKKRKNKKTGEWQDPSREEYNLLYVAITRAKTELVYVSGKGGIDAAA